ncbi:MAG: HPr family phosphocarrier protein [Anaerotignaceae bacterium]
MKNFVYTIKDEQGIHARPAGQLVKCAKELTSKITLTKEEKTVDITKLMALMSLGIKKGTEITITCEGENEEEDLKVMQKFLEENL